MHFGKSGGKSGAATHKFGLFPTPPCPPPSAFLCSCKESGHNAQLLEMGKSLCRGKDDLCTIPTGKIPVLFCALVLNHKGRKWIQRETGARLFWVLHSSLPHRPAPALSPRFAM